MKKNWTIRLLSGVAAGAMAFSMVGCGSSKEIVSFGGAGGLCHDDIIYELFSV